MSRMITNKYTLEQVFSNYGRELWTVFRDKEGNLVFALKLRALEIAPEFNCRHQTRDSAHRYISWEDWKTNFFVAFNDVHARMSIPEIYSRMVRGLYSIEGDYRSLLEIKMPETNNKNKSKNKETNSFGSFITF